jgi:hypothetical protein
VAPNITRDDDDDMILFKIDFLVPVVVSCGKLLLDAVFAFLLLVCHQNSKLKRVISFRKGSIEGASLRRTDVVAGTRNCITVLLCIL